MNENQKTIEAKKQKSTFYMSFIRYGEARYELVKLFEVFDGTFDVIIENYQPTENEKKDFLKSKYGEILKTILSVESYEN